jgi:hypothetical protein
MVLPRDPLKSLGITDPCLVTQLYLPLRRPFALELRVTDASGDRRRLIFSTSFKNVVSNPLHAQIPLAILPRGRWLNVCFDLLSLISSNFGKQFGICDSITVNPVCKLRKIFTLPQPPCDQDAIPKTLAYPPGTDSITVVFAADSAHASPAKSLPSASPQALSSAKKVRPKGCVSCAIDFVFLLLLSGRLPPCALHLDLVCRHSLRYSLPLVRHSRPLLRPPLRCKGKTMRASHVTAPLNPCLHPTARLRERRYATCTICTICTIWPSPALKLGERNNLLCKKMMCKGQVQG